MQLSRNWLAEYVELPASVEELARRLTEIGHAVDQVEVLGEDAILEVDITTNRPDCMNHLGMARDLAAAFGTAVKPPAIDLKEAAEKAENAARIEIEAPDLCRRYVGRVLRGVRVGQSPSWLVERLESIGLRAINNIVDVTNFVLWEYGQPLHAFDLDKLDQQSLRVRRARAGETLTTLDGESRELTEGMLVIADAREPVALAGVMGGLDSEVTADTTNVLLESAFFEPGTVRTTAGKLGMHSDASHRFERGADPEICSEAAARAAALMVELAGGEVLSGAIDVYPSPMEAKAIPLDPSRLVAFAGADIPREDMERWLTALGCKLTVDGEGWQVSPPSWRWQDLELPADLYEEVVRLYGLDRIEATLPALSGGDGHTAEDYRQGRRLRQHLVACGYQEAVNFAFHSQDSDGAFPGLYGAEAALELANPLSDRYRVLRRSLLPNLLESARFNQRRGAEEVRLFEIGHIFAQVPGKEAQAQEQDVLALVVGGQSGVPWEYGRQLDFFDLKGALESLSAAFGSPLRMQPAARPELAEGCAAEILLGSEMIGYCGRLAQNDGPFPLFVAELSPEALWLESTAEAISVPSRFPSIQADMTLTHSLETSWAEIRGTIEEIRPENLSEFRLKDRYQGKGVPKGAANTTITFTYSSPDRSLTQDEVNERQSTVAARLEGSYGWRDSAE